MMDQPVPSDQAFFGALEASDRKSQGCPPVRGDMRWILLLILIGLMVFLSNQLWILFMGAPLF
jgi:hypothetical protein